MPLTSVFRFVMCDRPPVDRDICRDWRSRGGLVVVGIPDGRCGTGSRP